LIADDLIIWGSGQTLAEAQLDHDKNLGALLDRCRANNIRLNKDKVRINCHKFNFMGHILTPQGLQIQPEKVRAILEAPLPSNKHELQQLIGAATFLARYTPNFSDVIAPLREMLHEKNAYCSFGILQCTRWRWTN
jgi:hypothetical protein